MAELPFLKYMDITGCRSKRPIRSSVDVLEKKKGRIEIPPRVKSLYILLTITYNQTPIQNLLEGVLPV